ncbi:MAG: D-alanyl-D-alanine carboxypeptidase/D-alanyl-D-alanine-endopeptidase [bacterium]
MKRTCTHILTWSMLMTLTAPAQSNAITSTTSASVIAETSDVESLSRTINDICALPHYASATVTVAFTDAATGKPFFERDALRSAVPASCMKAITTAAALHYLGASHRFTTTLEKRGTIDASGNLRGDLIIRGGGDPALGSNRIEGSATSATLLADWAKAVEKAGIKSIHGDIIVDDSFFTREPIPDAWDWVDIGNYYATGTSGLSFNDNLFHLYFEPGKSAGAPAKILRTDPELPGIEWINEMLTGPADSGDQGWIYGATGSPKRWTKGTIPMGPEFSIKGALPDPGLVLARELIKAGITICAQGNVRYYDSEHASLSKDNNEGTTRVIAMTQSPPLSQIVRTLNKQSFNFYAEMLLMHIARAAGNGTRDSGIAAEMRFLKQLGVDLRGVHISDGSGLSRNDCVTARAMTDLFRLAQKEPWFQAWHDSMPILGVDADLSEREKHSPIKGKVHAKTGLITRVRGLCGLLETASGRKVSFALFANNYDTGWTQVDKDFDTILRSAYDHLGKQRLPGR